MINQEEKLSEIKNEDLRDNFQYIEINQPIGTFYITKLKANILASIVNVTPRSAKNDEGIQRVESKKRIKEISDYCSDPDATFPTPIIISIYDNANITKLDQFFQIDTRSSVKIGEVIDGQHRLKGIKDSGYSEEFELLVVLMFNLTEEEKAYVFSIINSKQTKVSSSLIYDLFSLSQHRSPAKTAHEIARSLNRNLESPFYKRLKMLGRKVEGEEKATLSQGTFVKHLVELISKNPDKDYRASKKGIDFETDTMLPLRNYFIQDRDDVILKIIMNLFRALRETFPEYWENPSDNILWKTTGYIAIIKSFNQIYAIGKEKNDLSYNFFEDIFFDFKLYLQKKNIELTSEYFPSNAQQQTKLKNMLIESIRIG